DVIKLDFWNCVKYSESSDKLEKGCNPSFMALISKKNDPLSFSDYRPISLIGCIYKVITKILAACLAKVIGLVIRSNQSAFIEGRQILDGCLVANDIIRMASIENTKFLLFKVDFEKEFDSVNWNFFLDVMRQMGLGSKWRTWIASCLSPASIFVMINGSPSNEFKMEYACNKGLYNGVSLAGCLKVNISKTRILGVGVFKAEIKVVASSIGCAYGTFPFAYLGLPVKKKTRLKEGWNAIIDRFRDKISSWKAKNLSIGCSESQRGIYWVKWNSILLGHKFGGLGIGRRYEPSDDCLDRVAVAKNEVTQILEVVPFEEQSDDIKKKLAKNNEAKMVLYNALPKKEYERIFMCKTAKDIWQSLLITHQAKRKRVKTIGLKAKKCLSDDVNFDNRRSDDEEYARTCGDPNHLIGYCPKPSRNKDQKAFIGGSWSDSENDAEDKTNDETCLMAQSSNEVTLNSSHYSDDASSLDNDSMLENMLGTG
ncbi:putative RNA-directed DNA polymerase, eukaryota, reverse transcriptase zinc-binding domain protein, partial [Tanacetum coccineum]